MGNHGSMALADQQRAVKLALADIAARQGTAHVPTAVELVAELHGRRLHVDTGLLPSTELAVLANLDRLLTTLDDHIDDVYPCVCCGRTDHRHDRYCPAAALRAWLDTQHAQPAQAPAAQPHEPRG